MSEARPAKRARARLACEPCRRKKTKCLGEKPICSFCARLAQPCYYANGTVLAPYVQPLHHQQSSSSTPATPISVTNRTTEDRLQVLEARLAKVLEKPDNEHHPDLDPRPRLPPWTTISDAAKQYLLFCDCQPLPLFDKTVFVQTLHLRDPELLLAVLGLCSRFCKEQGSERTSSKMADSYVESSRRLVMERITTGPVELSTIQSLCLLSLVDFTNGNMHRANIHSSLAISLAHCAGLTSESLDDFSDSDLEERRRCFWSVFLLKRLHGVDTSVLDFFAEDNLPGYPKTTGRNMSLQQQSHEMATKNASGIGETTDLGIVAYAIQLSEVWYKTTKYARRRGASSNLPPWSPQSEYATVVAQTMDYETKMPYKHRYKQSGFAGKMLDELDQNRDYWSPWLFTQFLYHTNFCLLNHPLILALRLRSFKCSMPEMFLQHTADLISTHGSWIIHLIDTVQIKSYKITDPFIGYCVAIVSTIFLQESHTGDITLRSEKNNMFKKCFEFVQSFAQDWPHMARLTKELRKLEETISESRDTGDNPRTVTQSLLIDLGRVWQILEYASTSNTPTSSLGFFGRSLNVRRKQSISCITSTSVLPPPTRLEAATITEKAIVNNTRGAPNSDGTTMASNSSSTYENWFGSMQLFSDDELAVLVDSFFDQRADARSEVNDLLGPGNL